MITTQFANNKDVDVLMFHPELYDRMADDTCPSLEDFKQIMQYHNAVFIGGYVNGYIASLFIVHADDKMHFLALPEYKLMAGDLLKDAMKFWPYTVNCTIPVLHQALINFAKKHGFKEVERIPNDHLKNGVYYDSLKLINEGL